MIAPNALSGQVWLGRIVWRVRFYWCYRNSCRRGVLAAP